MMSRRRTVDEEDVHLAQSRVVVAEVRDDDVLAVDRVRTVVFAQQPRRMTQETRASKVLRLKTRRRDDAKARRKRHLCAGHGRNAAFIGP